MSKVKNIRVHCMHNGVEVAFYDFGHAETFVPSPPPSRQALIDEAKTCLTTQRIAFPPYAGITFEIDY